MTIKTELNQERWECVWWEWGVDCHLNGLVRSVLLRSLLLHQYLNEVKEWTKEISWIRTFSQRKQSVLMSWDESVPDTCKMQWGGQCGWEGVRGEGNGDQMSLIIEWLLHAGHHWALLASSPVRVIWTHLLAEKRRFSESGWLSMVTGLGSQVFWLQSPVLSPTPYCLPCGCFFCGWAVLACNGCPVLGQPFWLWVGQAQGIVEEPSGVSGLSAIFSPLRGCFFEPLVLGPASSLPWNPWLFPVLSLCGIQ